MAIVIMFETLKEAELENTKDDPIYTKVLDLIKDTILHPGPFATVRSRSILCSKLMIF